MSRTPRPLGVVASLEGIHPKDLGEVEDLGTTILGIPRLGRTRALPGLLYLRVDGPRRALGSITLSRDHWGWLVTGATSSTKAAGCRHDDFATSTALSSVPAIEGGSASTSAPAVGSGGATTADSVPAAGSPRTPSTASDATGGTGPPTSLPWPSIGCPVAAAPGMGGPLAEAAASAEVVAADVAASRASISHSTGSASIRSSTAS
jgi:hypothetical protein